MELGSKGRHWKWSPEALARARKRRRKGWSAYSRRKASIRQKARWARLKAGGVIAVDHMPHVVHEDSWKTMTCPYCKGEYKVRG